MRNICMLSQVFVGNIPYGTTEEQLMQIFSEVGRVLHVRMALNAENGRPKGYAFIEYEDPAAALSAIRNLNNRASLSSPLFVVASPDSRPLAPRTHSAQDLQGRQLRVNFSKDSALADYAHSVGEAVPEGGPADPRAANGAMTVQEVVDSLADAYEA